MNAKHPKLVAPVKEKGVAGRMVRVMTPEERRADIKAFGRDVRKNKASAVAFLQGAGILDQEGQLAEPFRA